MHIYAIAYPHGHAYHKVKAGSTAKHRANPSFPLPTPQASKSPFRSVHDVRSGRHDSMKGLDPHKRSSAEVELENFGEDLLNEMDHREMVCHPGPHSHTGCITALGILLSLVRLWGSSRGLGRDSDRAREPPFLKLWPLSQAEPISVVFVAVILYLLLHQLYTEREDEQGWQQQQRWPSIRTA